MVQLIKQKDFFEKYRIKQESYDKTTLKWDDLQAIYDDYSPKIPELKDTAIFLFNSLMKTNNVHSVRYRIKDAEHVIEKIIRKRIEEPDRIITIDNYQTELKDLIGVRALHLFKEQWQDIHQSITSNLDVKGTPVAYYREGDSSEYKNGFANLGCSIEEHRFGYRSVHYIVETKPAKEIYFAEIQVRTIFEEAWSEIDHTIRYPYDKENPVFGDFLLILNRLAGNADEMGTFIQFLKKDLQNKDDSYKQVLADKDKIISQLEDRLQKLKLGTTDTKYITDRLEKLKTPNTVNLWKDFIALEKLNTHNYINISDMILPVASSTIINVATQLAQQVLEKKKTSTTNKIR